MTEAAETRLIKISPKPLTDPNVTLVISGNELSKHDCSLTLGIPAPDVRVSVRVSVCVNAPATKIKDKIYLSNHTQKKINTQACIK